MIVEERRSLIRTGGYCSLPAEASLRISWKAVRSGRTLLVLLLMLAMVLLWIASFDLSDSQIPVELDHASSFSISHLDHAPFFSSNTFIRPASPLC